MIIIPTNETRIIDNYLKEISIYPLLTKEEEHSLSETIIKGSKANLLLEETKSEEDIIKLKDIIKQGEQARDKLIQSNYRLVVFIAKQKRRGNLSLMDLIQEGNLGLVRAAELFDYKKDTRFSTYATLWINQAIDRAYQNQNRTIRVPNHVQINNQTINRVVEEYMLKHNKRPTNKQIAKLANLTIEQVEYALLLPFAISLNRVINDDDQTTLEEVIPDLNLDNPDIKFEKEKLNDFLYKKINSLPKQQKQVILLRFGLENGKNHTLEEIANIKNLSIERIRQIEKQAIKNLRKLWKENK